MIALTASRSRCVLAIGFGVVEMLCLVGVVSTVRVNVLGERHQVAGSGCSMELDMPWLYTAEARERTAVGGSCRDV